MNYYVYICVFINACHLVWMNFSTFLYLLYLSVVVVGKIV